MDTDLRLIIKKISQEKLFDFVKKIANGKNIMDKESWIFILFILVSSLVDVTYYKRYLLFLCIYFLIIYFINKDLLKTTWITFFSALLFYKSKIFITIYEFPEYFLARISALSLNLDNIYRPTIVYYIAFADALLILLLYLLWRFRKTISSKLNIMKIDYIILGIMLVALISAYGSSMPEYSFFATLIFFKAIILFYIARILLIKPKFFIVTLEILLIFVVFNSLLIILQKFNGGPLGLFTEEYFGDFSAKFADESINLYRPGGIYRNSNITASLISMFIPLVFLYSFVKTKYSKVLMRVLFGILSVALVFTASRAVWVVGAILLVGCIWWLNRNSLIKKPNKYWIYSIILLILCMLPFILSRMASLYNAFDMDTGGAFFRMRHFQMAWDILKTYMLGLGLDTFRYEMLNRFPADYFYFNSTPPHNIFAEIAVGLGVVGLALFIGLFAMISKMCLKILSDMHKLSVTFVSLVFAVICYLLTSQFYNWLIHPPLHFIFWMILGYVYAVQKSTIKIKK